MTWTLAAMLFSRAVGAQPPPPTIILAFDASSETQKQAVAAIQAHVSGLPLQVVSVSVGRQHSLDLRLAESSALAASRDALGTFYIEVAEDRSLLIFFTEADGEATLIRRLRPSQQGMHVDLEQAAIVARSLVEALLDGGSVGISADADRSVGSKSQATRQETDPTQAPAPGTADAPRSKPPSPRPAEPGSDAGSRDERLAIAAGPALTQFAAGVPWQAGLSAGIHWLATPVLYAGARYTFFPALRLESMDADFSVGRHPLEALVGYRQRGRLALNAELGFMADRATRTTVRTAMSFQATSPDARWLFALAARGGFSWSPWSPLTASLRAGADFLLTPYAYTIESSEAPPSPRWVRPRVEFEVTVWLW